MLNHFKRGFKIGQKIAPVFDSERDADQTFRNTGIVQSLGGPGGVGGTARMAGQGFHAAERNGITRYFQIAEKLKSRSLAPLQVE